MRILARCRPVRHSWNPLGLPQCGSYKLRKILQLSKATARVLANVTLSDHCVLSLASPRQAFLVSRHVQSPTGTSGLGRLPYSLAYHSGLATHSHKWAADRKIQRFEPLASHDRRSSDRGAKR